MLSLKQRMLLKSGRVYRSTQTAIHELNYLFWECTLRCNLDCGHCGSDCRKSLAITDMPARDFLNVVDHLPEITNPNRTLIVLTGGEPLMRNDIADVGLELYKRGFPWGMVSNGMLLSRKKLNELLDVGLRSLTISLDGLADAHDRLRNKQGSFDKAVHAITFSAKEPDLVFDVVTCVHPGNLDELPELSKLLESLGVKKWRLFSIFPKGRAENSELILNKPEQVRQLILLSYFNFYSQSSSYL